MKFSSGQITLLITAVATTAVIVLSSRKPSSSPESAEQVEQMITAEDVKIEKALEIINGGGPPMEGILMLKELADADEPNLDAVFLLAQLSEISGQDSLAVERYNQLKELADADEPNIDAVFLLAQLNESFSQQTIAENEREEALLTAIDQESNVAEKNRLIKKLNEQQAEQTRQEKKAVERYTQVLELDPNQIEATWQLAMLNMKMGDLEDAVTRFELCVEEDAAFANGYFFIGQCFEAMGRSGKEREDSLLNALAEESNVADKNLLIQDLKYQQAQLPKHEQAALEAYKSYLPLSPDSATSMGVEAIINRLEVGATRANDVNP